jgi:hypothetical protein
MKSRFFTSQSAAVGVRICAVTGLGMPNSCTLLPRLSPRCPRPPLRFPKAVYHMMHVTTRFSFASHLQVVCTRRVFIFSSFRSFLISSFLLRTTSSVFQIVQLITSHLLNYRFVTKLLLQRMGRGWTTCLASSHCATPRLPAGTHMNYPFLFAIRSHKMGIYLQQLSDLF